MLLKSIHLDEVTCFTDLSMDFCIDGKPSQWIIILGENGTGKSTILKMIALNLMGPIIVNDIVDRIQLSKYRRSDTRFIPTVTVEIQSNKYDRYKIMGRSVYTSVLSLINSPTRNSNHIPQFSYPIYGVPDEENDERVIERLEKGLYSENTDSGWFAASYGPWRRTQGSSKLSRRDDIDIMMETKSGRFASLFIDEISLSSFVNWLIDLEFRILKDDKDLVSKHRKYIAIKSLESSLNGLKFKGISANREILFSDGNRDIPLEQLSDGYKSVASWMGDLTKRLIEAFPNSPSPLLEQGVVLVDELDIHLHPSWQKEIVPITRSVFPNIQFIVTTHSPFVAQDMEESDKLFVMSKKSDGVQAVEWTLPIGGWRVDQILTSKLFGLENTRNNKVDQVEKERIGILQKSVHSDLSEDDKVRLAELELWLSENKSKPTSENSEGFYDAANAFLKLLENTSEKDD